MKDNIREKFEVIQGYEGFEQGILSPKSIAIWEFDTFFFIFNLKILPI